MSERWAEKRPEEVVDDIRRVLNRELERPYRAPGPIIVNPAEARMLREAGMDVRNFEEFEKVL